MAPRSLRSMTSRSKSRDGSPNRSRSQSRASRTSRPSRPSSLSRYYSGSHINDMHPGSNTHDHHQYQYEIEDDTSDSRDPQDTSDTANDTDAAEEKEQYESPEDAEEDIARVEKGQEFDVEKDAKPVSLKRKASSIKKDPNVVSWEGPDDPENPKNWTYKRKWAATIVVSSFTFISPLSSSMVAPALSSIDAEFGITNEAVSALVLSIFVLAYAFGPLFLGPLSELYGRVPVLQLANLFFLVWNLACGFAQNTGEMLAFRLLAGLGGSAPLAVGGGVLADCWRPEERGKAIAIYSLAPLLGPAIGPLAGGFIAENTTWRWCFWSVTIADALIQISGLFFLRETYAPKLLHQKMLKLRKETGNEDLRSEFDDHDIPLHRKLETSLSRPFIMLFTQPIIIVLALYMAFLYGLCYLVLTSFPTLWTEYYHESVGIGGLNYISLGLGFFLGAQIGARANDRTYKKLKAKNNGIGKPEFRVPVLSASVFLTPIGLFWYGWSAQARIHWIMPNIGAVIFGAGIIVGFQITQTYIIDAYTRFAASGVAAAVVLRSLAGFGFPLFAAPMYAALGYGWGNSLLAFVAIVLGSLGPVVLWRYGEKLRSKSRFAAG